MRLLKIKYNGHKMFVNLLFLINKNSNILVKKFCTYLTHRKCKLTIVMIRVVLININNKIIS